MSQRITVVKWPDELDTSTREDLLTLIASSGVTMSHGGETHIEWGIRERGGVVACASEEHAYSVATCNDDRSVRQRTVTICVDGSEFRSPWSLPNPVVIEH